MTAARIGPKRGESLDNYMTYGFGGCHVAQAECLRYLRVKLLRNSPVLNRYDFCYKVKPCPFRSELAVF
jgi:hypothetical protein